MSEVRTGRWWVAVVRVVLRRGRAGVRCWWEVTAVRADEEVLCRQLDRVTHELPWRPEVDV